MPNKVNLNYAICKTDNISMRSKIEVFEVVLKSFCLVVVVQQCCWCCRNGAACDEQPAAPVILYGALANFFCQLAVLVTWPLITWLLVTQHHGVVRLGCSPSTFELRACGFRGAVAHDPMNQ